MEALRAHHSISWLKGCNPFRSPQMIRRNARVMVATIPASAYAPDARKLDDFRKDNAARVSSFMYLQIVHLFLHLAAIICPGRSQIPSGNKAYHNGLFFVEIVRKRRGLRPDPGHPGEYVDSDDEIEEDEKGDSDDQPFQVQLREATAVRLWLFNHHRDKEFSNLIRDLILANEKRKRSIGLSAMQLARHHAQGVDISSNVAALLPANVFAHTLLNSMNDWQALLQSYLQGDEDVMNPEYGSPEALGGDGLVNPEKAFSASWAMVNVPKEIPSEEKQTKLEVYWKPNSDEKSASPEWSFPDPACVTLYPPSQMGFMADVLISDAPFSARVVDKRRIVQDHARVSGQGVSLGSRMSMDVKEDVRRVNEEIAKSKRNARLTSEVKAQINEAFTYTQTMHLRTIKQAEIDEADPSRPRPSLNDTDVKRALEIQMFGNDADAVQRQRQQLQRREAFALGAVDARIQQQNQQGPAAAMAMGAPPVPPKKRKINVDTLPSGAIVDHSILASRVPPAQVDDDEYGGIPQYVTDLDEMRAEFKKKEEMIRAIVDDEQRKEHLAALRREKRRTSGRVWSQNAKLCKVHARVVRFTDDIIRERERAREMFVSRRAEMEAIIQRVKTNASLREQAKKTGLDVDLDYSNLLKEDPGSANLSTDWVHNLENVGPVGQMVFDMNMDVEHVMFGQHAHQTFYQVWVSANDAMRYSFGSHLDRLLTGQFASSKSWVMLALKEILVPGTFEILSHLTTHAMTTSGEENDLLKIIEEMPPGVLGISGNAGAGGEKNEKNDLQEALMKNQLTAHKHITVECFRTKEGMRVTKKHIRECIGVMIGAMNKFVHRVSDAMMSRLIHTPTRQISRSDRDMLDVVMKNMRDPKFVACQMRWRLRHAQQFLTEKFIQAGVLPNPTMFVADVLMRAWVDELSAQGVPSRGIRQFEHLWLTARCLTVQYANMMAYDSALSRIRGLPWKPKHHFEVLQWLWATEDICILATGLCADLYSSPAEEQLWTELNKMYGKGQLKAAKVKPAQAELDAQRMSKYQRKQQAAADAEEKDCEEDPDYVALKIKPGEELATCIEKIFSKLGSEAYPVDNFLGLIKKLAQRFIDADPDAPVVQGQERRTVPCVKHEEFQLLISKQWLKKSTAEKMKAAAEKVFCYDHARPRTVIWGRALEAVVKVDQTGAAPSKPQTVRAPFLFETIDIKPNPANKLYYVNATAQTADTESYLDSRYRNQSRPDPAAAPTHVFANAPRVRIKCDLDLLGLQMHARANPDDIDLSPKGFAWNTYPAKTNARLRKAQLAAKMPTKQYVYPDSFEPVKAPEPKDSSDMLEPIEVPDDSDDELDANEAKRQFARNAAAAVLPQPVAVPVDSDDDDEEEEKESDSEDEDEEDEVSGSDSDGDSHMAAAKIRQQKQQQWRRPQTRADIDSDTETREMLEVFV